MSVPPTLLPALLPGRALVCSGLRFAYPGRPEALRGIDLEIGCGERVGVVGPNGAGKTTLFHLACGLLQPAAGRIEVFGAPQRPGAFDPRLALLFQHADDQLFCPTVAEDVAFGPRNLGLDRAEIEARVREALAAVGALALAERPVHHLSGGEKRVVSLAGALALRPRLILFDEPSSGLDSRNRRRLIALLQAMTQTLLLASHDLELLLETCERAVLLDEGRVIAEGPIRAILGDAGLMTAHGQEVPHSLIPHRHGLPAARASG